MQNIVKRVKFYNSYGGLNFSEKTTKSYVELTIFYVIFFLTKLSPVLGGDFEYCLS